MLRLLPVIRPFGFFFAIALITSLAYSDSVAQKAGDSPVDHMNALDAHEEELSKKYLSYISEVAHGEKARRMEKRRQDVISSLRVALTQGGRIRPYKGDPSLRNAYTKYWGILLSLFNEDYHKIVDMEEIAERSYDAMEAYLLTQEKANEKLDQAHEELKASYRAFAANHNVRLTEGGENKLNRKLSQAGKVHRYSNEIFLIFFKTNVQESLMIEALNAGDINALEQSRASLLKFAGEGLARLDTIKPYNGDGSLTNACRKVLEFQRAEAGGKAQIYSDFLIKKEELDKIKKEYEGKDAAKRTEKDFEVYTASLKEYNGAVASFNKTNQELNAVREKVLNHWNITRKRFMDHHIPH